QLAARLSSTTGSLYWHFEDRDGLIRALMDYWEKESTDKVATLLQEVEGAPEERLLGLMKLIQANAATSGDVAIRSYAAHDAEAAAIVARSDARRAEVVGGMFRDIGFRGAELRMRTQLFLCYESCERFVASDATDAQRARLMRKRWEFYCRP
ncbi:MAG: hypothetical protein AAGD14_15865, partial [Planctomycetota bacterium]